MRRRTRLLSVGVVLCAAVAGTASGGSVIIGDFSDGLDDWSVIAMGPSALAELVGPAGSQQLHVRVANTWEWDGGAWTIPGGFPNASLLDVWLGERALGGELFYPPAGTTELGYSLASLTVDGSPPGNTQAYLRILVEYNDSSAAAEAKLPFDMTNPIPLPGIDTNQTLSLLISPVAALDIPEPEPGDPTSHTITVDAVFGNFTAQGAGIGVIPEPATILGCLLAVGSIGAYLRRRR